MSLRINTNVSAMGTHSNLVQVGQRLGVSIERLSSGLRINRAADDAAGLTISEKLRTQIRSLNRATMNAQDGISMIQVAEGALESSVSILQRMRELATQAANDVLTSGDRLEIQSEILQLKADLDRIANSTEFNTKRLLDGSQSAVSSTSTKYAKCLAVDDVPVGGDYYVSVSVLKGGVSQLSRTLNYTIKDNLGELAHADTMLISIAQFYDNTGTFLIDDPQQITVSGNGKSTEVYVDAYTTLAELAQRIQEGLLDPDFGLGIESSICRYISTAQTKLAKVGGYLEITSGFIGTQGEISLSGNNKLIDAIGLGVFRESVNNQLEVYLTDGKKIERTVQVSENRAPGLLQGIDVAFTSQPAQAASKKGLVEGIKFAKDEVLTFEAGGVTKTVIVKAGYWTKEGLVRNFNEQFALDSPLSPAMSGMTAKIFNDQIMFEYRPSAEVANDTGTTFTISNADIYSPLQIASRTYSGFAASDINQEFRAYGYSNYLPSAISSLQTLIEVGDGINSTHIDFGRIFSSQSASFTVPDMIEVKSFTKTLNQILETASVAVRVDQVENSIVFTSVQLGNRNVKNLPYAPGIVSIKSVATVATSLQATTKELLKYFGIEEGIYQGVGETNFKLHIRATENHYHIGPNRSDVMKVAMFDMSSEALGVDNINLSTLKGAQNALAKIARAMDIVGSHRANLGAYQNRLEHAIENLRVTHTNTSASESRIRDTDFALEMVELTRNQVISQSATAMLVQANSMSNSILELLRG